jgi:hypothetical protein
VSGIDIRHLNHKHQPPTATTSPSPAVSAIHCRSQEPQSGSSIESRCTPLSSCSGVMRTFVALRLLSSSTSSISAFTDVCWEARRQSQQIWYVMFPAPKLCNMGTNTALPSRPNKLPSLMRADIARTTAKTTMPNNNANPTSRHAFARLASSYGRFSPRLASSSSPPGSSTTSRLCPSTSNPPANATSSSWSRTAWALPLYL